MKKLIISPHVDDDVLGCGGIMDEDTFVLYCGLDETGIPDRPTSEERISEINNVMSITKHSYKILDNLVNRYESIASYKESENIDLSGGQLQRIIIARAIYHNKNILILDEFTSALDYKNEKNVLDIIKEKQINNKITIMCSSHKKIIENYSDNAYKIVNANLEKLNLWSLNNLDDFKK